MAFTEPVLTKRIHADPAKRKLHWYDDYVATGGYAPLRKSLDLKPDDIIKTVTDSAGNTLVPRRAGARVVGISSGASAPEELVQRLIEFFRARGTKHIEEFQVIREDVRFMLPKTIRQAVAARDS